MAPFKNRWHLSREEIKEIFLEHDMDGDGVLSISDITQAFSFLGNLVPHHKARYGLAYADADGDGVINEDELDKLVDYAMRFHSKRCWLSPLLG